MKMGIVAAVAMGGAIGSVTRYFVSGIQNPAWTGFPYGIFTVNVTGGFVMGLLTELMALKFSVSPEVRAFLTTGIMGGYTTFSTFSLESALLIQRGAYVTATGYVAGSAVLSIAALFCGLWLVRAIYA
jgi:CrcB protein